MRLSSQTSVDMQTQHPRMSKSDRSRRLAFFAQASSPDIAAVGGCCHRWHKMLTTDVTRSKHRRSQQVRQKGNGTGNKICLHCPRPAKNLRRRQENPNTPLRRPSTPTGRRVRSTNRNCAPQNGCNGEAVPTQRTCKSLSVHVRCRLADTIKTFPHFSARRVFKLDFASQWTRHDIVSHGIRFSAHRQLMSHLTICSRTLRQGALVIFVRLQTLQFGSFGNFVNRYCCPPFLLEGRGLGRGASGGCSRSLPDDFGCLSTEPPVISSSHSSMSRNRSPDVVCRTRPLPAEPLVVPAEPSGDTIDTKLSDLQGTNLPLFNKPW